MDYFNYYTVVVLLLFSFGCNGKAQTLPEQRSISSETAAIYERFYLTKRIEKAFELLQKEEVQHRFTYTYITPELYQHPLILTMARIMQNQKSLAPLLQGWRVCKNYQQLYDARFQVEFVHILYAVCSELDSTKRTILSIPAQSSVADLIQEIDGLVRSYIEGTHYRKIKSNPTEEITTDMIAQRYLILKRLDKSFRLLQQLYNHGTSVDLRKKQHQNPSAMVFDLDIEKFTHSRIQECIQQMYNKKNLEPLVHIAEDTQQYRFVADDLFLQEMLMNLFLVYKGLLFQASSEEDGELIAAQMHQVLEIYENIDEMPLDETLEAIDLVTDRLLALQHMEQSSQFSRVATWIAPCVTAAACAGALIYYYALW